MKIGNSSIVKYLILYLFFRFKIVLGGNDGDVCIIGRQFLDLKIRCYDDRSRVVSHHRLLFSLISQYEVIRVRPKSKNKLLSI